MLGHLSTELGMILSEEKSGVNMCDSIQTFRVHTEFVDYTDGVACMQALRMCIYVDLITPSFLSNTLGFPMCIYVDSITEYH